MLLTISDASSLALLELTCPLDSMHYIEAARSIRQNKTGYLQLLAEFELISIMKSVYWDHPSFSHNQVFHVTDFRCCS